MSGLALGIAQLTFESFSDQGAIAFGDARLRVRKEGWINPGWSLEHDGSAVAFAKKRSLFGRSYDLTCHEGALLLKPQTLLTRGYDILLGDTIIGSIEPEHPLTRKARVEFQVAVSEMTQLFCFWLVAMVWRSTTDASPA